MRFSIFLLCALLSAPAMAADTASAAVAASSIEVRVAGGAGYAKSSPASRRFREAAFIPVQSHSESQLRWELAKARGEEVGRS